MQELTLNDAKAAVKGGSIYACGGGVSLAHGLVLLKALQKEIARKKSLPKLVSANELEPEDIIVFVAAIGAPATMGINVDPNDYIEAVKVLQKEYQKRFGKKIVGTMTPQNGWSSTLNGWLPALSLDLVVLDAVGDMRAHPTAVMGTLGLGTDPAFETFQIAVSKDKLTGAPLIIKGFGQVGDIEKKIRKESARAQGFIASARNPLPVSTIKERGVLGGISAAIKLGKAMIHAEKESKNILEAICRTTNGKIIAKGTVVSNNFVTAGGFDVGTCVIEANGDEYILYAMNEWMAVDQRKKGSTKKIRKSTYPDIEAVIFQKEGRPLNVSEIQKGMEVALLIVTPKDGLLIPSGVNDPRLYTKVDEALGINILQ